VAVLAALRLTAKPSTWGKTPQQRISAAAVFIKTNISLFPTLKKGKRGEVDSFLILAGVTNKNVRNAIIDQAIQLVGRG